MAAQRNSIVQLLTENRRSTRELLRESQMRIARHIGEKTIRLNQKSKVGPGVDTVAPGFPAEHDGHARSRLDKPHEELDSGRLTGAVRSKESVDFALGTFKVRSSSATIVP